MLRRDEVDIVNFADLLQLDIPLGEFFGGKVESVALVGDILLIDQHGYPNLSNAFL